MTAANAWVDAKTKENKAKLEKNLSKEKKENQDEEVKKIGKSIFEIFVHADEEDSGDSTSSFEELKRIKKKKKLEKKETISSGDKHFLQVPKLVHSKALKGKRKKNKKTLADSLRTQLSLTTNLISMADPSRKGNSKESEIAAKSLPLLKKTFSTEHETFDKTPEKPDQISFELTSSDSNKIEKLKEIPRHKRFFKCLLAPTSAKVYTSFNSFGVNSQNSSIKGSQDSQKLNFFHAKSFDNTSNEKIKNCKTKNSFDKVIDHPKKIEQNYFIEISNFIKSNSCDYSKKTDDHSRYIQSTSNDIVMKTSNTYQKNNEDGKIKNTFETENEIYDLKLENEIKENYKNMKTNSTNFSDINLFMNITCSNTTTTNSTDNNNYKINEGNTDSTINNINVLTCILSDSCSLEEKMNEGVCVTQSQNISADTKNYYNHTNNHITALNKNACGPALLEYNSANKKSDSCECEKQMAGDKKDELKSHLHLSELSIETRMPERDVNDRFLQNNTHFNDYPTFSTKKVSSCKNLKTEGNQINLPLSILRYKKFDFSDENCKNFNSKLPRNKRGKDSNAVNVTEHLNQCKDKESDTEYEKNSMKLGVKSEYFKTVISKRPIFVRQAKVYEDDEKKDIGKKIKSENLHCLKEELSFETHKNLIKNEIFHKNSTNQFKFLKNSNLTFIYKNSNISKTYPIEKNLCLNFTKSFREAAMANIIENNDNVINGNLNIGNQQQNHLKSSLEQKENLKYTAKVGSNNTKVTLEEINTRERDKLTKLEIELRSAADGNSKLILSRSNLCQLKTDKKSFEIKSRSLENINSYNSPELASLKHVLQCKNNNSNNKEIFGNNFNKIFHKQLKINVENTLYKSSVNGCNEIFKEKPEIDTHKWLELKNDVSCKSKTNRKEDTKVNYENYHSEVGINNYENCESIKRELTSFGHSDEKNALTLLVLSRNENAVKKKKKIELEEKINQNKENQVDDVVKSAFETASEEGHSEKSCIVNKDKTFSTSNKNFIEKTLNKNVLVNNSVSKLKSSNSTKEKNEYFKVQNNNDSSFNTSNNFETSLKKVIPFQNLLEKPITPIIIVESEQSLIHQTSIQQAPLPSIQQNSINTLSIPNTESLFNPHNTTPFQNNESKTSQIQKTVKYNSYPLDTYQSSGKRSQSIFLPSNIQNFIRRKSSSFTTKMLNKSSNLKTFKNKNQKYIKDFIFRRRCSEGLWNRKTQNIQQKVYSDSDQNLKKSNEKKLKSSNSPSSNSFKQLSMPKLTTTAFWNLISRNQDESEQERKRIRHQKKTENRARKALRTITIILGAFIFCWTPWHVLSLIMGFCSNAGFECVPIILYDISYWLCYLNSLLNPFCYAFANHQFKQAFLRIIKLDWNKT